MNRRSITISVRAVILRDDQVLLTLHEHPERTVPKFWCFPGGGVEAGESCVHALQREVREETGLDVVPGNVVFVQEFADRELLDLFFAIRDVKGEPRLGTDPEPQANHLIDVRWIPRSELSSHTVLPEALARRLTSEPRLPEIPFRVIGKDLRE